MHRRNRADEKKLWLFYSTLLNAVLAASKLIWGAVMGSTLVTADGIHSISDVVGALLIFLALYFARHTSDRFPYGLHKLEDIAAVLGGLGIITAGYRIIYSVFFESGIKTPDSIRTTVGFILVIVIIQFLFYYFEKKTADRLQSPGMKADAVNWLGDIGAGLIVVTGLIAHRFHVPYAQKAAVIIIIAMILKGAYGVLKEGFLSLLDASDIELTRRIHDLVMSDPSVKSIQRLSVRKSGSVCFAVIDLTILESNAVKAHNAIEAITDKLKQSVTSLESVTIHYEPDHPPYKTVVELLEEDKKTPSTRFGATPWLRITRTDEKGTVISDTVIRNPAAESSRGKAFRLVAWLVSQHADKVVIGRTNHLDENVITLLEELGITMVQI